MHKIKVVDLEKLNNFHVGHFFHLSPILKVISALQFGPWNFQKLRLGPLSPSSSLLALFFPAAAVQRRPPAVESQPATSASRWHSHVAPNPLHRFLLRAGASPAVPRRPEPPAGRHLAAAVASPGQSPKTTSVTRTSTTKALASHSSRPFTCSSLPRPRTHRRHPQNTGELHAAVEPTSPQLLRPR